MVMEEMEKTISGDDRDPIDIAVEYAELSAQKKALDAELRKVKEKKDELQATLIKVFEERGIARLTVAGQTLYPYARTYLRLVDKSQAFDAARKLEEAGLGDAIVLGTQRLTSVYNEDPEAFPPSISAMFEPQETWYIGSRKSN